MATRTTITALALAVSMLASGTADAHEPSPWRTLISPPPAGAEVHPLDRFALAWQLHDTELAESAFADTTWSRHLREWARARWASLHGDHDDAALAFDRAREAWPATREEDPEILAVFDHMRLQSALEHQDVVRARAILESPLVPTEDDPVRVALQAWLLWLEGDLPGAVAGFDAAWRAAGASARRHPAFLRYAPVLLESERAVDAGAVWTAIVDGLVRPERQREALRVWDATPGLRRAPRSDQDHRTLLRWLVRMFRRDDALELARAAAEDADGSVRDAWSYVFVAEQFYRLRRHEELAAWLDRDWPRDLDDEQRAELEAYPWGVERRGGHSVRVAAGFDGVALRYPGTSRAVEALWESGWMWELSDEVEVAIDRYDELRRRDPAGPHGSAAAVRSLWLRLGRGDLEGIRSVHSQAEPHLRDGLDAAAGLWIRSIVEPQTEAEWRAELAREHPASPLWRPLPEVAAPVDDDVRDVALRLHSAQVAAFERLAREVGVEGDVGSDLAVVERLAQLGLFVEAEIRLSEWAAARRSDTVAITRAVRLAWKWGLPEIQGRYGWILERRLRDDGDGPARDAGIAAMPTPFATIVLETAIREAIDPAAIWGLIRRESFYDADVVSIAGAHGLMQLIESTARDTAARRGHEEPSTDDLLSPAVNLELGISYLSGLFDRAEGDRVRALASYNAGETMGRRWQERRNPAYGEAAGILVISYNETRDYVYHVLRHWIRYRELYGTEFGAR